MAEQNGMEKPDLQALPTINDRMTFLYLEHCKIHREDGAITARDLEGTLYIPAAAITVLESVLGSFYAIQFLSVHHLAQRQQLCFFFLLCHDYDVGH